jgi:hypothetical protein
MGSHRRTRSILRTVLAPLCVVALGCSAPGQPDPETTGSASQAILNPQICALSSSAGAKEICQPDTAKLQDLWAKAASTPGALPIRMYAPYPEDVNALVASAADLKTWYANIAKVTDFLKNSQKNADSYGASLKDKIGPLLDGAQKAQAALVDPKHADPNNALADFKAAMTKSADTQRGPLGSALTNDKATVTAVTKIVTDAQAAAIPLQTQYKAIADRYKTYRASEAAAIAGYTRLSQSAAVADLPGVPTVQSQLIAFNQTENDAPSSLIEDATKLRMTLGMAASTVAKQLAPYAEASARIGLRTPDLWSAGIQSLDGMVAYAQTRRRRNNELATRLLDELAQRRQALVLVATDLATRDTKAKAALLAASKTFLDSATAQTAALWKLPPTSTKLQLPFLAAQFDQFTQFMQLQSLCSVGAKTTWRESGCNALGQQFSRAQTYLTKTIPGQIKLGLLQLPAAGVSPAVIQGIRAKLTAGDVKAAALAYDAALQTTDGVTP